jgi:hypothetical protein
MHGDRHPGDLHAALGGLVTGIPEQVGEQLAEQNVSMAGVGAAEDGATRGELGPDPAVASQIGLLHRGQLGGEGHTVKMETDGRKTSQHGPRYRRPGRTAHDARPAR